MSARSRWVANVLVVFVAPVFLLDGSVGSPFDTIGAALAVAGAGDAVAVGIEANAGSAVDFMRTTVADRPWWPPRAAPRR